MYWLMYNLFPISVGINTFITIMLLAITTSCDGGGDSDNTRHTHLRHALLHLAWRPSWFYRSQLEAGHLIIPKTRKGPVHIPNQKRASPYPQLESGQVHIPNRKGAMQKSWRWAPYQKRPKKMPRALTLPQRIHVSIDTVHVASPIRQHRVVSTPLQHLGQSPNKHHVHKKGACPLCKGPEIPHSRWTNAVSNKHFRAGQFFVPYLLTHLIVYRAYESMFRAKGLGK